MLHSLGAEKTPREGVERPKDLQFQEMEGRRSATPMLSALAELRAAVNAKP